MQLQQPQRDGHPLRAHLQAAADSGATPDPRLAQRPPRAAATLWGVFCQLSNSRPSGMAAAAIPPSEVLAWQQLHGVRLTPWELDTLALMDQAALQAMRKPQ